MNTAIWWIRRDLRSSDNQALAAAMHQANVVIPLFILDPRLLASPDVGQSRLAFMFDGLRALDASLRGRGSALSYTARRSAGGASYPVPGGWSGRHLC